MLLRALSGPGLIPAHAGKTRSWLARSGRAWAHPRSHGENPSMPGGTYVDEGSSPLTRGKPAAPRGAEVRDGLIPAHAGKIRPRSRRYGTSRAHPHSCGENMVSDGKVSLEDGSSPLTRGKPGVHNPEGAARGLIPAHTGRTCVRYAGCRCSRAHPHSCGENGTLAVQDLCATGSSPLTRGKLGEAGRCEGRVGLIPTHAGKTLQSVGGFYSWAAHPCSRGENHWQEWALAQIPGPSPLTRGKRLRTRSRGRAGRLIPAHAGKTIAHLSSGPCARAHPHSCGENVKTVLTMFQTVGSSPLMRGKRQRWFPCRRRSRLIPAHAGKTSEYTPCPG